MIFELGFSDRAKEQLRALKTNKGLASSPQPLPSILDFKQDKIVFVEYKNFFKNSLGVDV
jgi:hypothetical protein